MSIPARFLRWCHCISWLLRPWLWSTESHRAVDIRRLGARKTSIQCECGKEF